MSVAWWYNFRYSTDRKARSGRQACSCVLYLSILMNHISQITVRAWDVPMRAPYRSAQRITTVAHNVLVTVTLADGTQGFGESAPATYVTGETQASVVQALQAVGPPLTGQAVGEALEVVPEVLPFSMPGARAALETALLDAAARQAHVPLFRYLGAETDTVPSAVTDLSLPLLPPDEAHARAREAYGRGFRAFKIKVGGPDTDEDRARVLAVAQAAPDAMLRLDGNQGFSSEAAIQFVETLSDLVSRIELFEQPTRAGDTQAMYQVHHALPPSLPVFADESVHNAEDARTLLESEACGGVVLKLAKSGISETRRIAEATYKAGGRCMFGCMMETRIAIGAALHLTLALGPEVVPMLDLDGILLVNDEDLLDGGVTETGALLRASADAPGLGVTLRSMAA